MKTHINPQHWYLLTNGDNVPVKGIELLHNPYYEETEPQYFSKDESIVKSYKDAFELPKKDQMKYALCRDLSEMRGEWKGETFMVELDLVLKIINENLEYLAKI